MARLWSYSGSSAWRRKAILAPTAAPFVLSFSQEVLAWLNTVQLVAKGSRDKHRSSLPSSGCSQNAPDRIYAHVTKKCDFRGIKSCNCLTILWTPQLHSEVREERKVGVKKETGAVVDGGPRNNFDHLGIFNVH